MKRSEFISHSLFGAAAAAMAATDTMLSIKRGTKGPTNLKVKKIDPAPAPAKQWDAMERPVYPKYVERQFIHPESAFGPQTVIAFMTWVPMINGKQLLLRRDHAVSSLEHIHQEREFAMHSLHMDAFNILRLTEKEADQLSKRYAI